MAAFPEACARTLSNCPIFPPPKTRQEAKPLPSTAAFMGRRGEGPSFYLSHTVGLMLAGGLGPH